MFYNDSGNRHVNKMILDVRVNKAILRNNNDKMRRRLVDNDDDNKNTLERRIMVVSLTLERAARTV